MPGLRDLAVASPMQGWLMALSSQLLDPAAPLVCHSVGTILFTAIGISLVAIAAHGAFRVPDDLFLDDGEVFTLVHAAAPAGSMHNLSLECCMHNTLAVGKRYHCRRIPACSC